MINRRTFLEENLFYGEIQKKVPPIEKNALFYISPIRI